MTKLTVQEPMTGREQIKISNDPLYALAKFHRAFKTLDSQLME